MRRAARCEFLALTGSVFALACTGCTDPRFELDAAVSDASKVADGDSGDPGPVGRDAGVDAGPVREAGTDAMTPRDAQIPVEAGSLCGTPQAPDSLGDDCAGDVACGNAKSCDLTRALCCIDLLGDDRCSSSGSCAGERKRARCDGTEDCQGGQVCCFSEGYTACADACPAVSLQLCHIDAECPSGVPCVSGRPTLPIRLYEFWGFCGEGK